MITDKYYNLSKYKLFSICRSITGKGIRKTLKIIKNEFPKLKIAYVKSGTNVFDWKIPSEWNIKDAYVLDSNDNKIINFKKNNLHIVNYSIPINKVITKKELLKHIHTNKKLPNAIPYVTSYYKKYWGFCCSDNQKKIIEKKYNQLSKFRVVIKSSLKKKGKLSYGEIVIPGKSRQEILVSTYICHPSMANNELSGPIVSMSLINFFLKQKNLPKTLRFIFIPETIGSITFLYKNLTYLKKNLIGGYNLSCIGDNRMHSCMLTKYANALSDRSLIEAYKKLNIRPKIYSFLNRGSDERQYNSPGVDLPIASIFRSKYHEYKEYHTSLDNFNLVTKKGVFGGYKVARYAIELLSKKIIPKNKIICEPQLSKRNLYPHISVYRYKKTTTSKYLDFLQYSDGKNDLHDISKKIKLDIKECGKLLKNLLKKKIVYI